MKFTIPLPPPLNATYRYGKGRYYKAIEVRDWENLAGYAIKLSPEKKKTMTEGNIYVGLAMYLNRDRDIDSSIKTVLDLLQSLKIYSNDKQVSFLNVRKEFDKKNPRMEIEVTYL